jgi:hypothetical protein
MKHKLQHSKTANVTDGSGATNVTVLINGIPHLDFLKKKYEGMLSWYESNVDFKIEIYLKNQVILTEYNSLEKWEAVLNIIRSQV